MKKYSNFLRFLFKKDSNFGIYTKWGMMTASKTEEDCLFHISEFV